MFIKCTTIYCLLLSFLFVSQIPAAYSQNLPYSKSELKLSTEGLTITKDDLIYMTDTLSTVNDFTKIQKNGCEAQGITNFLTVNEYDCLNKLNRANEKNLACLNIYIQTKNTKRLSLMDECKTFDKNNAADILAQQAFMVKTMKNLLDKFKTGDPDSNLKNLSPIEKNLFYALFDALAEKQNTRYSLKLKESKNNPDDILLKKASDINQLQALGFEISESNSENLKINIKSSSTLDLERLKNINTPEYAIIESYLGKDIASNLKNMYVDPPLNKRGPTQSVSIGDMIIIPNSGTSNDSKPLIINKNKYREIEKSLFENFARKNIQCLELSKEVNSKTHIVKEFIKGSKVDPLNNKKEACLNDMAKIHHAMIFKLGIAKPVTDNVFTMLKLAIEKDGQNYEKNNKISELLDITNEGLKTFSDIIIPKNVFSIKNGKVVLKDLSKNESSDKTKSNTKKDLLNNTSSKESHSCFAIEYGDKLALNKMDNLLDLSKKDAIKLILPFLTEDLKQNSSNLNKLSMLEEYPTAKDFLKIEENESDETIRLNKAFKKINAFEVESAKEKKSKAENLKENNPLNQEKVKTATENKNTEILKSDDKKANEKINDFIKKDNTVNPYPLNTLPTLKPKNILDAYNNSLRIECLNKIKNDISPITLGSRKLISWDEEKKACVDQRHLSKPKENKDTLLEAAPLKKEITSNDVIGNYYRSLEIACAEKIKNELKYSNDISKNNITWDDKNKLCIDKTVELLDKKITIENNDKTVALLDKSKVIKDNDKTIELLDKKNVIENDDKTVELLDKKKAIEINDKKENAFLNNYVKALEAECKQKDISITTNKPRNIFTWDNVNKTCINKKTSTSPLVLNNNDKTKKQEINQAEKAKNTSQNNDNSLISDNKENENDTLIEKKTNLTNTEPTEDEKIKSVPTVLSEENNKKELVKASTEDQELKKKAIEDEKLCLSKIQMDLDANGKSRGNLTWNKENNKCEDKIQLEKDKIACDEVIKNDSDMKWNIKTHICENPEKTCEKLAEDRPLENWTWFKEKNECKIVLTSEHQACLDKASLEAKENKSNTSWNNTTNKCEDKLVVAQEKKTCDELTLKDKSKLWNTQTNTCEDLKLSCEKKDSTKEKRFSWNASSNACDEIKFNKQNLCDQKNLDKDGKEVIDVESGRPIIRYEWNYDKEACIDLKSRRKDNAESDDDEEDITSTLNNLPLKRAPGRFRPVTIPTRQPYMMPGMP